MDITEFGIAAIPAITVICYLIGMACKASNLSNTWIPTIMGVSGAVLGVTAMFVMPDFPGTDYITSVAIGAISGFAATGINQIVVQASKYGETSSKG